MSTATAPRPAKSPRSRHKTVAPANAMLPCTLKARSRPGDTSLQRHASFFDDNGDRNIDVAECTRGLKVLGLPFGVAEAAAIAIVAPLSLLTRGSLLAMNIDIDRIQRGEHDSDTGILDQRGRFNTRRFEKVFGTRFALDRRGGKAFTATAITRMVYANRESIMGFLVALVEWDALLLLAADTVVVEDGKRVPALSIARIKSFYDGSLFYRIAEERA